MNSPLAPAVACSGMRTDAPLSAAPLSDEAFAALMTDIKAARLDGLLGQTVSDGLLPVTDEQRAEVADRTIAAAVAALRIERRLLSAIETLDRAGIDYRIIKGPALAHTVYPDPAHRGFGDVDLLIRSSEWEHAVAALEAKGAYRTLPELRPGFDRRFGKEATLVGADRIEIDLHRTFVIGPLGLTVNLSSLFTNPVQFEMGGRSIPTLPPVTRFMAACFNAALADDPPNLHALRDVAQILMIDRPVTEDIITVATEWRARAVVARAMMLTSDTLSLLDKHPLFTWARSYRAGAVEARLVRSYQGGGRSYVSQGAALWVIPGLHLKAAYLRAIVWPQPEYLASRGFTRTSHWHRARRFVFGDDSRRAG